MWRLSVVAFFVAFAPVCGYVAPPPTKGSASPTRGLRGRGQGHFSPWAEATEQAEAEASWNPLGLGFALGMVIVLLTSSPAPSMAEDWDHNDIPGWNKKFPMCSQRSESQSPVDIKEVDASKPPQSLADFANYNPVSATQIVHNGHVMQVNGKFGQLRLPDGEYEVKQFHFHFPAEHKINGKLAAGEMHIVHQRKGASGTDGLAVVGILLSETNNAGNSEEIKFLTNLGFGSELPVKGEKTNNADMVDLNAFKAQLRSGFYHYSGSLTTPPCSEGVRWYVVNQTAPVTSAMIKTFKERFPEPGDARPVQGLNGRPVLLNHLSLAGEFDSPSLIEVLRQPGLNADTSLEAAKKRIKQKLERSMKAIDDEAAAKKKALVDESEKKSALLSEKINALSERRQAARLAQLKAEEAEAELEALELIG